MNVLKNALTQLCGKYSFKKNPRQCVYMAIIYSKYNSKIPKPDNVVSPQLCFNNRSLKYMELSTINKKKKSI